MMAVLIEKRRRRRRKSASSEMMTTNKQDKFTYENSSIYAKFVSNEQQQLLNNSRVSNDDVLIPTPAHQKVEDNKFHLSLPIEGGHSFRPQKHTIKLPVRQHCKVRRSEAGAIYRLGLLFMPLLFISTFVAFVVGLMNLSFVASANGQLQLQQRQSQQPTGFYGTGNSVIVAPQASGKAKYNTNTACEDRQLTIECDIGATINLIRANFGRFSVTQCNEQGQLDLSTDCMSPITFRIMRERCQDKQRCSVNATSSIFGDRCPKTRKYLEVHYQCQLDQRVALNEEPERVNVRNLSAPGNSVLQTNGAVASSAAESTILPPNNPPFSFQPIAKVNPQQQQPSNLEDNHLANAVQAPNPSRAPSSHIMQQPNIQQLQQQPMTVMNSDMLSYNTLSGQTSSSQAQTGEPIVVTLRHTHTENMSNARCVLWDPAANQWTERGSRVIDSNQTHTVCAFDQATSYLLVMDYLAPYQMPNPSSVPQIGPPFPNMLDLQPVLLDSSATTRSNMSQQPAPSASSSSPSPLVKFLSLFGYLLAFAFVAIAITTTAFIVSSMRSTAGATLKSLGNFAAFSGPKYKGARSTGRSLDGSSGINKDLLVINSQSGHQFLYAPAQSTKISSSASTHILTGGHQTGATLHHQHQPLYSTNGTLSNLSGTGAQSNNYYGLTGLTPYFQQQHFASQYQASNQQHQLNQLQQQQAMQPMSYLHQANKSTISNESANSSPSSSGVESGSTSVQHQQQCLMMNNPNDFNLMNQLSNFGQTGSHLMQQQQQPQPTLTLNAHYSGAGLGAQLGSPMSQHQLNQLNQTMQREHIYECVDDQDKSYAAQLLLPADVGTNFSSNTLGAANQQQQQVTNGSRTLSSRLFQQQVNQQQQQQNKRLFSHPAIVRDNQPAKTNIICSKLAQVTPQRATEIQSQTSNGVGKFHQDIMAIYNGTDTSTITSNSNNYTSNLLARKLSTDC